tara:strand:- start:91 stop:726 length:636 start_codon:yes stop_codon:yes gene_type:complete
MSECPIYKIILIGSSSVGKTSLCSCINGNEFNEKMPITIGVDFSMINLTVNDEKIILQIWDTAGHERYRTITKSYYKGAHIIFLCFDLTNIKSFFDLNYWMDEIKNIITDKYTYICLFGLKCDLEHVVYNTDIETFMQKHVITTYRQFSSKKSNDLVNILENIITKYNLRINELEYINKKINKELNENKVINISEHSHIDPNDNFSIRNCC